MKGSRVLAVVLVLLMISAPWSLATADPVLYTIEFVASGLSSGPHVVTPMADEPLVFAGVTDTATVAALAQANLTELAQLIASLGYVAGLGFGIAAIVKFKEHKNNPVQHGFAIEVSFPSPLTVPVVRDGELVTLTIDSILNNTLVLQTRHVAGGL